jgi:hypothetical protein
MDPERAGPISRSPAITAVVTMKVTSTRSTKTGSDIRRPRKAAGGGTRFAEELSAAVDPSATAPAGETTPTSAVGSILSAQEASGDEGRRRRTLARERGEDLLDRLERLRREILVGAVSREQLQELARRLRAGRITSDDPRLNEILAEIELRTQVEIAKLTRDA